MHIYIRTGNNENTGITFNDGTQWEEAGSNTGFTCTPATRYAEKPEPGLYVHMVPFGDRGLAALYLALGELEALESETEIDSLTWIRSNSSVFHDLKALFRLDGTTCEDLISEIKETLDRYLVKKTLDGHLVKETPGRKIILTHSDLERVELASGQPFDLALLDPDKPQGFTITSEDGESTKTYEIPGFLEQNVYLLPDEQRTLAMYALALEKLRALPNHELVNGITYPPEGLGYTQEDGNDLIPSLSKDPTDAGTVAKYLWNLLATYTKRG